MQEYKLYHDDLHSDVTLVGDIAIDTETMGLNFVQRDRLCLMQIADQNRNIFLIKFNNNFDKATNLKSVLQDDSVQKIFHFARFDLGVIKHYLGVDIKNVFCTKIASKLVRTYTMYHGLKDICKELLGIMLNKYVQSSNWGQDQLTSDQISYAINDVLYLHDLRDKLNLMLKQEDRLHIAQSMFAFLSTRVELDILGYTDLFAHSEK